MYLLVFHSAQVQNATCTNALLNMQASVLGVFVCALRELTKTSQAVILELTSEYLTPHTVTLKLIQLLHQKSLFSRALRMRLLEVVEAAQERYVDHSVTWILGQFLHNLKVRLAEELLNMLRMRDHQLQLLSHLKRLPFAFGVHLCWDVVPFSILNPLLPSLLSDFGTVQQPTGPSIRRLFLLISAAFKHQGPCLSNTVTERLIQLESNKHP